MAIGDGGRLSGSGGGRWGRLGLSTLLMLGIGVGSAGALAAGIVGSSVAGAASVTGGSPGHIVAVNSHGPSLTSYPLDATGNASPSSTIDGTRPSLDRPWMATGDGSGDLWVANCTSDSVVEFTAAQLTSSGSPVPAVTLSWNGSGSLACPEGIAFDGNGNLWVSTLGGTGGLAGTGSVVEFTAGQLGSSGSPTPAVTLTAPTGTGTVLAGPYALAFDGSGNLWVSNFLSSTLDQYSPVQQGAGGSPAPAVVIGSSSGSLYGPTGLAFDGSGNLWVANYSGDSLVELAAATLTVSGTPTPTVRLTATGTSLAKPVTPAFDATGDLWVTNTSNNTVVELTATQLAASGSPVPAVTIASTTGSGTTGSLATPAGLVQVAGGGFWVANEGSSTLVRYAATQVASSGAPVPAVTVAATRTVSIVGPYADAFDAAGNLWVTDCTTSSISEYSPAQVAAGGALTPVVVIGSTTLATSTTPSLTCPLGIA
ncbi:MAG TPA: hypothetical protein VHW47_03775, partial [Acidimicrobiales bacterium]|nr:hypothetical protein [Acidimicrobiales bacterium]